MNNTVIDPNDRTPGPPWIRVANHKNGTPSETCVIRNNLTAALNVEEADTVAVDHNLVLQHPEEMMATTKAEDLDAIRQVSAAWRAAWEAGDLEGLMALYADDPILMPQNHPLVAGKEAIRALYEAVLEAYQVRGDGGLQEVTVSGDWGYYRVAYTLSATPKAGGETIHDTGKSLFIVTRPPGGAWRIARLIDNSDLPSP